MVASPDAATPKSSIRFMQRDGDLVPDSVHFQRIEVQINVHACGSRGYVDRKVDAALEVHDCQLAFEAEGWSIRMQCRPPIVTM